MKQYLLGIRVYSTDLGFIQAKRSIDFLLDGKTITKDNVVFIAEDSISPGYANEFLRRGYNLIEIKNIGVLNFINLDLIWDIVSGSTSLLEAYEKVVWETILKTISFKHFVCYNDTSPAHIFRNRVLKAHNILTWYYNHSGDYAYLYDNQMEGSLCSFYAEDKRIYGNLEYDNMICWNSEQVAFFRKLGCKIDKYYVFGPLWTQDIGRVENPHQISIFDTTCREDFPNTQKDIEQFIDGICNLRKLFPEHAFVYKNKMLLKDAPERIRDKYLSMRQYDITLTDIGGEASDVIGSSNLVICVPFTSIALEAMGVGIPAIYYDPSDKYRGTLYDKQGIVAHTFVELLELTRRKLNVGTVPSHMNENRSIDRFREVMLGY